jgi:lysozyme
MKLSKTGLDLITSFEGYLKKQPDGSCKAYQCPAKVWTCGWGCTEGVTPNTHWTKEEAEKKFATELAKFEKAVDRLVKVPLNQNQYDALVSFAYNCGEGALGKSGLLRRLNKSDYAGACAEFAKWNRGGGRVLRGLTRRRAAEAALFATKVPSAVEAPEDDEDEGPVDGVMAQSVDNPKSEKTGAVVNASGSSLLGFLTGRTTGSAPATPPTQAIKSGIEKASEMKMMAETGKSVGLWAKADPLTVVIFGVAIVGIWLVVPLFGKLFNKGT